MSPVALPSASGEASLGRFAANAAGAGFGIMLFYETTSGYIPPKILGLDTTGGKGFDLGDVIAGAHALLGAMLANKLYSSLAG